MYKMAEDVQYREVRVGETVVSALVMENYVAPTRAGYRGGVSQGTGQRPCKLLVDHVSAELPVRHRKYDGGGLRVCSLVPDGGTSMTSKTVSCRQSNAHTPQVRRNTRRWV